jgi:hypothetical protein
MVPNCLIPHTLLLQRITLLPNLFPKQLLITGSLAAKVTENWFHGLLLLTTGTF